MRRPSKSSPPKLSTDSQRLIGFSHAVAQAASRLEERAWERSLDTLSQKLLKSNHQDTIDAALDNVAAEKLNAETKAFGICADAYIKARRTTVETYQAIANAHANAANAFATDFNSYSTALAAFGAARAAKAEKDKKKK